MCWCSHTIKLKCTRSYLVMNSLLSTYSQLYQPRLCMHLFSQDILIHQARINITIIISRINKKRNNSITYLTFHFNNGFLVISLLVVHNYINPRNAMANIPNCLHLLNAIYMRPLTMVQWKILVAMIFSTYLALQWSPTIIYVLLLFRLWPMSLLNCIKIIVRNHILSHLYLKVFPT